MTDKASPFSSVLIFFFFFLYVHLSLSLSLFSSLCFLSIYGRSSPLFPFSAFRFSLPARNHVYSDLSARSRAKRIGEDLLLGAY